jgi:hypothetical protein
MQTTAEEFTQQNDLHKNNTLFDTSFRGLLSALEKQKPKKKTNVIDCFIYTHGNIQDIIL